MYKRRQSGKTHLAQNYVPQAVFASLLLHGVFLLLYIPNTHLMRTGKIIHAPLIITLAPKIRASVKQGEKENQKGQDAFSQKAQNKKVKSAIKSTSVAKTKGIEKATVKPTPIEKPKAMTVAKADIRKKAVVIEHPPIILTPEKKPAPVVDPVPTVKPTPIVETPPAIAPTPQVEVETKTSPLPEAAPKIIEAPKADIRKKAVIIEHPPIMLTPEKKPMPVVDPKPTVKPTPIVETPPVIAPTPQVEVETKTSPLPEVAAKPIVEPAPTIVPLPEIAAKPETIFEPLPESMPEPVAQSFEPPKPVQQPAPMIAPQPTREPEKTVITPKPDPEPKKDIKVMAKAKTIEEPTTFTVPEEMANVPTLKRATQTQPLNRTDNFLRDQTDQYSPNIAIPRDIYTADGGVTSSNRQPSQPGATDMMAYIRQQREARAMQGDPSAINALNSAQQSKGNAANSANAAEQSAINNQQVKIVHHRGMFKITTLRQYEGTFSFKGWRGKYSNTTPRFYRVETFDARMDIRLLMVNKMIEVIQHDYKGEFQWQSNRFINVVTLSADPKYHGELQQFLLDEFKPEFDALQRP